MKFSIIINNYNYAQYIEECIESVLAQTYKNYELIIVDDGSTDNSVAIIDKYADQATVIKKENGGQGSAYNIGFSACSGDLIIFLDADDFLYHTAIENIVSRWMANVVKAHFYLDIINFNGEDLGRRIPGSLHHGDVTDKIRTFGCYASSPGSANVYCRTALEKILPMNESDWRIAADSYTINIVPFFGNVITIPESLGAYRIGPKPDDSLASQFVFNNSPSTPWDSVKRSLDSLAIIKKYLINNELINNEVVFQLTPSLCKIMLISRKFFPHQHIKATGMTNGISFYVYRGVISAVNWSGYSIKNKSLLMLWFLFVGFLPSRLAKVPALLLINPQFFKSKLE